MVWHWVSNKEYIFVDVAAAGEAKRDPEQTPTQWSAEELSDLKLLAQKIKLLLLYCD